MLGIRDLKTDGNSTGLIVSIRFTELLGKFRVDLGVVRMLNQQFANFDQGEFLVPEISCNLCGKESALASGL